MQKKYSEESLEKGGKHLNTSSDEEEKKSKM